MANLNISFYKKKKVLKTLSSYEDSFLNNGNVSWFLFLSLWL